MGVRILAGTEPGSRFQHACLWDSVTDTAFGPVVYEDRALDLSPDEVLQQFLEWLPKDARQYDNETLHDKLVEFTKTLKPSSEGAQ